MVYTIEKGIINTKAKFNKLTVGLVAITMPASIALFGSGAFAAVSTDYTLFGDASLVSPGNSSDTAVEATSTGTNAFGGVTLNEPTGLTVNDLQTLSTDFKGDCGLGSPRFSVAVTNGSTSGNLFFYLGDAPNYNTCDSSTWVNSGNLADGANLVDATQIGGTFYEPYSQVQTDYGDFDITSIDLVVDGPDQTVDFDNTQINDTTYDYEEAVEVNEPTNKQDCKNGGWMNFTDAEDNPFENQGQCVAYVNGGGTHVHNKSKITNNNNIGVLNLNAQNAQSGRAVVKNNTTGGNATSGNAGNSNSASFNIVVSNF